MHTAHQEKLSASVQPFVAGLNKRYDSYASERFITALLVTTIAQKWEDQQESNHPDFDKAVYDSGCYVFDVILTGKLNAPGNGLKVSEDLRKHLEHFEVEVLKAQPVG
ncbi:MAG: hypothetical protein JWM20_323 [Patescibacteria group bacterium]|nr:hypothetical protein [Patescibacteria group bacterium]